MLRMLIAHGGVRVQATAIIEQRWPNAEGDAGKRRSTATCTVCRLIGVDDVLLTSEGTLSFDPSKCWIDTKALDDVVTRVECVARTSSVRGRPSRRS